MERKFTVKNLILVVSSLIVIDTSAQSGRNGSGWLNIIEDTIVFDNNDHAAFTALEEWNGGLIVAFREGEAHDSSPTNKGVIRLLHRNEKGWELQHTFEKEGIDLRDPAILKLNNKLFLYTHMFYSQYNEDGWSDLKPISHNAPYAPKLPSIWKKRVYNNIAYGVGGRRGEWPLLMKSEDGINWQVVCEYKLGGNASEADMVFIDNTMYICIRVDTPEGSNSFWGISEYPFTECRWSVMNISIASPEMIVHSKKTILLASREYDYHRQDGTNKRYVTLFALDKKGRVKARHMLVDDAGSQGDQGYPSFNRGIHGFYYMSYYAGYRNRTQVRLLSFKVNERKLNKEKLSKNKP